MSLNWKEIDAVLAELDLVGSHIQKIVQPDFRNIAMELFGPHGAVPVRIALETGETRIHRAYDRSKKPEKRQRFAQLLHSRVKGARITGAGQVNSDRIVRIDVIRAGETTILWVRLWGGAANMVVTDAAGTILDAFFRRPSRGEVSGGHFFVPADPDSVTLRAQKLNEFSSRFVAEPEAEGSGPGSVNHQVAEHYRTRRHESVRESMMQRVTRTIDRREKQLRDRIAKLSGPATSAAEIERLRLYGDVILANLHLLSGGESWLEADDYSHDNQPIAIELDPKLKAQDNAKRYYQKARKASKLAEARTEELANIDRQLDELSSARRELEQCNSDRLETFLAKYERAGGGSRGRAADQGDARSAPGLVFNSNGYRILVGRNARENDEILRHHVNGNDAWVHTRDYPGGYVFVKAQKAKSVPLEVLLDAGNLAVHYSRAKNDGRAELYYTFVKYLRRAKDGPRGLVLPTQEKNLSITLEPQRISRLQGQPHY